MSSKIRHIIAEVIGVPVEQVGDDASPATLEAWDSLRHMNLIVALEDELGVTFDDDALGRLTSLPAILEELSRVEVAA